MPGRPNSALRAKFGLKKLDGHILYKYIEVVLIKTRARPETAESPGLERYGCFWALTDGSFTGYADPALKNRYPKEGRTGKTKKTALPKAKPEAVFASKLESCKEGAMILVLFEVTVKKEGMQGYLSLAARLKDELARADGFIRSERFSSLINEGKLLSLSVWENEQAVDKWRNSMNHRMSQRQGRDFLFESYTITIASKIRSYTMTDRAETPQDSKEFFV